MFQVGLNRGDTLADARNREALELTLIEFTEEPLHEVQPGGAVGTKWGGRRLGGMVTRASYQ